MRKFFAILFVVLLPLTAAALPPTDGETLIYNVQYRARLIPPIGLMKVTMRTMLVPDYAGTGVPHYHIIGNGRTVGAVENMFALNDTYHSWLDVETLLPSRTTSDIHEQNYRLRATYVYDWKSRVVNNTSRKATWSANRYASLPLKDNSGDAMALFYRLRAVDVDKLVVGRGNPLDLVLNEVTKPIQYTYHGRENIKIKRLGTRRALKFTCTMATSDGSVYEDGMTLTVWVSDDDRRVPLLMECPVRVGRVTVTLIE